MGEEFVAVIKLVSGEEILASVCVDETGDEPIIIAHTPVTMKMINNGMYVKIKPWMELADDDMFVFRTDKIITMSEVKDDKIIKIYERYVEEENEEDDITKLYLLVVKLRLIKRWDMSQVLKMLARVLRISLRII